MSAESGGLTEHPFPAALRTAMRLEWATVAWNVCEVFVTLALGIAARSLALLAFGLDSVVEIFASVVILWQLREHPESVGRSPRALRLVSLAFFALAVILIAGSIQGLVAQRHADDSVPGIIYLAVTSAVMFTLAWRKRVVSSSVGSHPLEHEARITFLDGMLAAGIMLALAANAAFGWWWADALAAMAVGLAAIPEGISAPREH
jgi:divalent metal cation (Fe/Co/Zn/Cd) transporter